MARGVFLYGDSKVVDKPVAELPPITPVCDIVGHRVTAVVGLVGGTLELYFDNNTRCQMALSPSVLPC